MYATFYMYGVSSLLFFYTGSFAVTLIGSRPKLNPKTVVAQFVPITSVRAGLNNNNNTPIICIILYIIICVPIIL